MSQITINLSNIDYVELLEVSESESIMTIYYPGARKFEFTLLNENATTLLEKIKTFEGELTWRPSDGDFELDL